jgi:hypothetical protein
MQLANVLVTQFKSLKDFNSPVQPCLRCLRLHFISIFVYVYMLAQTLFYNVKIYVSSASASKTVSMKHHQNKNNKNYNLEWWITRLVGRWRTQLTACRRVNCRTHEHRRFERKWRSKVNFRPRLAEGRIWNKRKSCSFKLKALMLWPVWKIHRRVLNSSVRSLIALS